MKRIATAAVLVPLVLAAVFWLPIWMFSIVVGLVALATAHEFLNLCDASGLEPFRYPILFFIALLFVAYPLTANQSATVAVYPRMTLVVPLSPLLSLAIVLLACFVTLVAGMGRQTLASVL